MLMIIMKIGIVVTFALLFFSVFFYINNLIIKRKKAAEEKKKVKIQEEDYARVEKGEEEEKLEPGMEKLSEKAKQKYFNFKEVFPKYTYKKDKLLKMAIGVVLFFLLTFFLNFVFGIIGFIIGRNILNMISDHIVKKRINKFELQLVDGLTLIANALKAGASFSQAVEVMVKETRPPLATEFSRFLKETRVGASVEGALDNLSRRGRSEELKIAVVSINIARQAGGNLSEILLHTADTIRERERIKGKIESLTSQGKMSGMVVGALPLGLAMILYVVDPIMMDPLFHSFIGQMVMLVVLLMEFVGFKWINKIVNIDI